MSIERNQASVVKWILFAVRLNKKADKFKKFHREREIRRRDRNEGKTHVEKSEHRHSIKIEAFPP